MPNIIIIYSSLMFVALIVTLTAVSIKKHGFSWPPAAIGAVIGLVMLLQRIRTAGAFNLVNLISVVCNVCIIYIVIGFVMRKIVKK